MGAEGLATSVRLTASVAGARLPTSPAGARSPSSTAGAWSRARLSLLCVGVVMELGAGGGLLLPPALSATLERGGLRLWLLPPHALGALLIALALRGLLPPERLQAGPAARRRDLTLLFAVPLALPLCGGAGLCAALYIGLLARRRAAEPELRLTPVPPLPYRPHAISERPAYDEGALSSTLRACSDPERRLRAVLAARALREPEEVAILQLALRDPVDDVRLLAYSLLDRREQALNQLMQALQRTLSQTPAAHPAQITLHRRLAQAGFELVALGLARGEVQSYLLAAARDHLKEVLQRVPRDRASQLLLGRVYLRLRKPRQADGVLREAAVLGLAADLLAEPRAEAALRRRRLGELRGHLDALSEEALATRPLLRGLARHFLAGHKRPLRSQVPTAASRLRSTGAAWDVES